MNEENKMADQWKIIHSMKLGDKEMVIGVDVYNTDKRYMTAFRSQKSFDLSYEGVFASDDYTQIVEFFGERIVRQANKIRAEQSIEIKRGIIRPEQCYPNYFNQSITNKVVAILPSALSPEYQTLDNQILFCKGGIGARACTYERKDCICINLYSGKKIIIERDKIQGEIMPEHLPEWAKERIVEIKAQLTSERKNKDDAR